MSARNIINRIKKELNIEHDKELAELSGIKIGTLTQAIARNSFQYEIWIPFLIEKGIDLNILNLDNLTIKTEQPNMLKNLETKYLFYKEYVGLRVVEKLDDDIQALIEKYDGLVVVLENLMEQEGIK